MKNLKLKIEQTKATPFQKKVWKALLEIPRGKVKTYSWIAKKIGHPKAVRAVGSAVGKNPFAPEVPCHRVIRSDGKLGGYSGIGGIKTKRDLLKKKALFLLETII
ncbi:MAG: MGMT family protein [Deltaproteobacteria bacterium]|nr:MAG: MGMT family protein [Deltaproteobacteria bacterium]